VSITVPAGVTEWIRPLRRPADPDADTALGTGTPAVIQFGLFDSSFVADSAINPRITIYNTRQMAELHEIDPHDLRASIDSVTIPDGLPLINADRDVAGRAEPIAFQNGRGLRFIAHYRQSPAPILEHMVYQVVGLTDDDQYYVEVSLWVDLAQPTEGPLSLDTDVDLFEYLAALSEVISTADESAFSPSLDVLDTMIESLNVAPVGLE
jgi:hypothetical protein